MANGTTRLALARMQEDGKQNGEHEYIEEIQLEKIESKKAQEKITLKNPSEHNHSR